jgi:hypothetical protein
MATYTGKVTEDFFAEIYKDGEFHTSVGPWADKENAETYIKNHLHTYEERDLEIANGAEPVRQLKGLITRKLKKLGWLDSAINDLFIDDGIITQTVPLIVNEEIVAE